MTVEKAKKIIILEKGSLKVKEPNFCGPYCSLVCGAFILVPD
jgi:hypothetical protein